MKIKRFFAPDIRQAINKVREELGPDAVILSNRQVDGGVEIVSAIDYDESILEPPTKPQSSPPPPKHPTLTKVIKANKTGATTTSNAALVPPNLTASREWAQNYLREIQQSNAETAGARGARNESAASDKTRRKRVPGEPKEATEQPSKAAPAAGRASEQHAATAQAAMAHQPAALTSMQQELQGLRVLLEQQLASVAWGDLARRHPMRAKLLRRLIELGLSPQLARDVAGRVAEENDFLRVWRRGLATLAQDIPVVDDAKLSEGGVVALVGGTGVGKTTTIAKLAARYALRHGTKGLALVTTDSFRVGAQEQLRTYGRILNVPVRIANDAEQLKTVIKGLHDKHLVLIDTAGMSQKDMRLTKHFAMLAEGAPAIKPFLVLAANAQLPVLQDTVRVFKPMNLAGCIVTKLDEAVRLGGAVSVIIQSRLPVAYLGNGQRVPEDIAPARAVNLVNHCIEMLRQTDYRFDDETIELAFGGLASNDHS